MLEEWYAINKRILPWRETKDPYRIWLSEVILQQTRVSQGLPYYLRFEEQYPTVAQLAAASQDEILKLWEGLGYYSRARNLHAAAKQIVETYNGIFPTTYAELLHIKGIGPYTAAAIASICFHAKVGVVDGNVYRVLARLYGVTTPINRSAGQKSFYALAQRIISSATSPGNYNQAIMEFGATHCTPNAPKCATCIFASTCVAFTTGQINALPVKLRAKPLKNRYLNYLICIANGKIAVQKRPDGDIWAGLYEFPLTETTKTATPTALRNTEQLKTQPKLHYGPEKHLLSHQRLWISFWQVVELPQTRSTQIQWVDLEALGQFAFPVVLKRFVESNLLLLAHRSQ